MELCLVARKPQAGYDCLHVYESVLTGVFNPSQGLIRLLVVHDPGIQDHSSRTRAGQSE